MSAVEFLGRQSAGGRWLGTLAVLALVVAPGCKSGGSWNAKPAWWSFGQTPPAAGDGLASAPAFNGDATKPSATAKPYPTTSTPQGYALEQSSAPAADAAPVTYGVTQPPAAAAPANLAQWSPSASAPPAAAGPIAPQVGPYATTQAGPPATAAAAALPPATNEPPAALAAVPQPSPPPAVPAAAPRMADARASSPDWTGSADAVAPPANPSSRYGVAASRFSGAPDAAGSAAFPAAPAAAAPAAFPAAPSAATPAAPAAWPTELPAPGSAPLAAPPGPPVRRPDPGYRPGGTSSYRPARTSIAGGADPGVQPASFESRSAIAP